MENYFKPATTKTPQIDFNLNGEFKISGNSYMENPALFYADLTEWLMAFLEQNSGRISLHVHLVYINTSSTKAILKFMTLITNTAMSDLKIVWEYQIDDGEMLELGEDLQKITQANFEFKKI